MTIQTATPLLSRFSSVNAQWKETLVQDYVGKRISDLRTPSLVIDKTILEHNCKSLACISSLDVKVRVHVKTHKTVEGARIQLEGAKTNAIVVSTLAEAHEMIHSDLTKSGLLKDVLLGFPITPDKFEDMYELSQNVECFQTFIDNLDTLEALESYAKEKATKNPFHVILKVNCGYDRAGVPLNDPDTLELAKRLDKSPYIHFVGIYTHAGHSYSSTNPQEALQYLKDECDSARQFKEYFEKNGINIGFVSIGATPTVKAVVAHINSVNMKDILSGIDEVHAGAFAFLDRQQVATGLGTYKDVAISVACRVASIYKDRGSVLIDGGALAFSKDTAPQKGFGYAVDTLVNQDYNKDPKIIGNLKKVSQEHGILEYTSSDVSWKINDVIRVIPNHCCLTAASHLFYLIVENGSDKVVDVWIPVKGW